MLQIPRPGMSLRLDKRQDFSMRNFRQLKLTDQVIQEANKFFDWRAAAELPNGQLLGKMTPNKRPQPNAIPDRRITFLDKLIQLKGKSVLEIGCFEGIHTLGLLSYTDDVTGIDLRPTNIFKTLARLSLHGAHAKIFLANAEELDPSFGKFDVVFHFGVLYHLLDPVAHIHAIGTVGRYLFLDTHVAPEDRELDSYTVDGESYAYISVGEGGWKDPFSGAHETSKHLSIESLQRALAKSGFQSSKVLQFRAERNGPRILLIAARDQDVSGLPEFTHDWMKEGSST
jgi:2-polyprenyl-3-methyl-5-hydroxy-6-metoxy-1,4-benzoquinol methylase